MGLPAAERIAALVQDLPAMPVAAQRALALLSDPATEPEQLQEAIACDQALSLRALRMANSAHYRRNREVSTVSAAVVVLGFKTIQTLLLTSAAHRVIASAQDVAAPLWDHSYAAAVACRELAREAGEGVLKREEAFLAGLFHDVGKGVIAARFPGVYREATGVVGERDALDFDHGELGEVLLTQWAIPANLAAAVGGHHDVGPSPLGELVVIGEWLSWAVAPGVGAVAPARPEALLTARGFGAEFLGDILETVKLYLDEESGPHEPS